MKSNKISTSFSLIAILVLNISLFATLRAFAQNLASYPAGNTYQAPADPKVKEKVARWQELKFGLFMHWGTYSQWGVVESWSICPEDQTFTERKGPYANNYFQYKQEYEKLQTTFNPTKFNPDKWADAARYAGMKYMVFTTKHHDGFAMYDTKYSDYKVTSPKTPFSSNPKSNVSREVFNSFRNKDFMVGAYFSKPDWHSEDFWWSYFPPKDRGENYDRQKYPDRWNRFAQYTYNQIQEIMTGYGKLDILWFDGDWAKLKMDTIVQMARKDQPGIIIVDRYGKPEYVNYLTPEQQVPPAYIPYPWETCMTIGDYWSYHPNDNFKTSRKLIQLLVDIVAKNGNLLLDVGPGPDGEWHPTAYARLKEVGDWIKLNGESIYDTKPVSPYRKDQWAFTGKDNAVYISYIPTDREEKLPERLSIPFEQVSKKSRISLLGNKQTLRWLKTGAGIQVTLPRELITKTSGQAVWVFKLDQ